ncbi:FAD-dependent monooxygenase [Streptomyces sp. NBC_01244]|uniref:FAD-dependent monooxygenase n=1 Tax=Streptomyces sp. NBC_01244 TaxID=2903797 RepID=UPI002E14967B|nr:FAD-dependent monooxygenase [Streptomyces sp. NBC_01244]
MSTSPEHILIAGAGIGGLTAAVALQRRGIACTIIEATPRPTAINASILLQNNTMRVLSELDIARCLAPKGRRIAHTSIMSVTGKVLTEVKAEDVEGTVGAPALGIHRADLHEALLSRLQDGTLIAGDPVIGFETTAGGVAVYLRSGERLQGRGLVAADGIDSRIRARLHGDRPAVRSGTTCLRGVTETPAERPDEVLEWWGYRLQFGIIPLPDGRSSWFALIPTPTRPVQDPGDRLGFYQRLYREFPVQVRDLMAATEPKNTIEVELRHRPWRGGSGAVTLLGDAAHPMLPNLGQGAGQAIEDAAVLARRLDKAASVADAFRAYEQERRARVRWIQRQAIRMNQIASVPPGPLSTARDAVLRGLPARVERTSVMRMFDGAHT